MLKHILTEKIQGKRYKAGGLKKDKVDPRDFKLGGWFGYTPKLTRKVIEPLCIRDQENHNTCTQESIAYQSEARENTFLSAQSVTCLALEAGVISGDGLSTLRAIQDLVKKKGICEKELLNGNRANFTSYSAPFNLTQIIRDNAYTHRTQSYWQITTRDARLKAIDDGYCLATGLDWYTGWFMNWGFSAPWIISGAKGTKVGGHAITMIGYDLNYNGQKVYVFVNSYGQGYGDNGKFYVSMEFFDQVGYPCYAQMDIALDLAGFFQAYDGHYVKGTSPAIYFIENGTKRAFPNWIVYLAHGGMKGQAEKVSDDLLNAVPSGLPIDIQETAGWPVVHEVSQPDNLQKAQEYAKLPL